MFQYFHTLLIKIRRSSMQKKQYAVFSVLLLIFLWCGSFIIQGQDGQKVNYNDAAPIQNIAPADTAPSANFPYPVLFRWHYSTIAPQNGGTVGALYFQDKYYLNAWNSANLFLYDGGLSGPQNFTLLTYQGEIRDLTTDGTWIYGSPASTTIHRMDANGISQGTITSAGGVARAIAYSPDENAFFISDFSNNISVIDAATGSLIRTLTGTSALTGKYGMAYSTAAQVPGGPYLWVWGQGTNADPYNKLWKVDPQTGTVIETYQFGPLPPGTTSPLGIAGGMGISQIEDRWVLLLNYQNFELQGYDLGPVQTGGPGFATDPNPANGATGVEINADLSWTNPAGATSIEVFFGTDPGSLTSVYSGVPVTTFDPGTLQYGTQYYWRVDETDTSGTTTGFTWNFTTRLAGPGPATNPNPADGASNVSIDADLSWDNPAGATSIEVFFGTDPGSLTSVYSGVPVTTFDPGTMDYYTQYFWRVNETDGTGTYVGPVWSFRTEFAPGVNILQANPGPSNNGLSSGAGIFFNLIASPTHNIEVFQMTTANSGAAGANFSIEFFVRDGNALGGPVSSGPGSSPAGWTSLGSVPVTQGAVGNGVSLPFATPPIVVNAGDTVGVAMVFTGAGPRYFGTGSPPYGVYSNSTLTLVTGDSRSTPFTTGGTFFASRELVGEIYYNASAIPVELASFTASVGKEGVKL